MHINIDKYTYKIYFWRYVANITHWFLTPIHYINNNQTKIYNAHGVLWDKPLLYICLSLNFINFFGNSKLCYRFK